MPLTAEDRLILIRVKVKRAKKHLAEMETKFIDGQIKELYAVVENPDARTSYPSAYPVIGFEVLAGAGDVIHNLRSALDHLANQLVWANRQTPSHQVEFPVAEDESRYKKTKAAKVEGISPDAVKAIDALKPYGSGNEALWRLHSLDNVDKHRMLLNIFTDTLLTADWLPIEFPFLRKEGNLHFAGILDDDMDKNLKFSSGKALPDLQVLESGALIPTLHQLVEFVDNLILSFKPFLE